MIDQSLVNHVESYIIDGRNLPVNVTENILDAYIKLTEQNAELHKELAKLKGDRVFVVNDSHDDMEVNKIVSWSCNTK